MAKILTLAAALFAITACNDFDAKQTTKSAVAGAAVGAGANYLAGEDVATGATVGAVGGAVLENVLDVPR